MAIQTSAGGDMAGTNGVGIVKQASKLDPLVTADTGIRRPTGAIVGSEGVDDLLKVCRQVERIQRHAEAVGDPPSIDCVSDATAALMTGPGCLAFDDRQAVSCWYGGLPMPHEDADAFVARLNQQGGGDA